MTRRSALLVDIAELPMLAFCWLAFLVWVYCLPLSLKFVGFGWWLLPYAGGWAHHPLHDGISTQELREFHEKENA